MRSRRFNPYYKLIGKLPVPCGDMMEWAQWFEHSLPERIVDNTDIGPLNVSTVFLGLDHGWDDKVRLFETMVFGDEDTMIELAPGRGKLFRTTLNYQERYETWGEAEEGHKRACAWAQAELDKLAVKLTVVKHDR